MLVKAPGFCNEPAYTMTVYGTAELLFRYGKANSYRRLLSRLPVCNNVGEPYRKNRKRLPGKEKRMNMLLALEPLIYLKSITNGKKYLKVKDYFRRLSSDTVSL